MQAIARLQRLSNRMYARRLNLAGRVLDQVIRLMFAASVPGRATIGDNVFFHHSGLGVVINNLSVIEEGCEIGVQVVLGGRAPIKGAPHLEKGVIVHAGAKLIGPIRIGEGSIVAAGSVVLEDVPPRCLVAGAPAVVKRRDIDASLYRHDAPPSETTDAG